MNKLYTIIRRGLYQCIIKIKNVEGRESKKAAHHCSRSSMKTVQFTTVQMPSKTAQ